MKRSTTTPKQEVLVEGQQMPILNQMSRYLKIHIDSE